MSMVRNMRCPPVKVGTASTLKCKNLIILPLNLHNNRFISIFVVEKQSVKLHYMPYDFTKVRKDSAKLLCIAEKDGKIIDLQLVSYDYEAERFAKDCMLKKANCAFADAGFGEWQKSEEGKKFSITNYPLNKQRKPNAVRCMETGEVYENVKELCDALKKYSRWTIDVRIKNHLPINGKHYEIII